MAQDIAVPGGGPPDAALAISTAIPRPAGIARSVTGTLYFSAPDAGRIYMLDTSGRLYLIAGNGTVAGIDGMRAIDARLIRPLGLALDGARLFVAEAGGNRVRKIDLASGLITTVAGQGGELNNPSAVAYDYNGGILIADTGNHRIHRLATATGIMTTVAGTGTAGFSGDGAAALNAELNAPTGIAVGASGNIFIADSRNNRVRRIANTTRIITTLASVATDTIACTSAGNVLFVSRTSARIEFISASSGAVSHEIGNTTTGYSGENVYAYSATINTNPTSGLATDDFGAIWFADSENFRIRRTITTTGVVRTVAGTGAPADGGALAADREGNLFVADSVSRRINKVDAGSGFVSTAAGGGAGFGGGDGGLAIDASFKAPASVTIDAAGNVFVGDTSVVRKIDAVTGLISTVAGQSSQNAFGGDGGPATNATLGCCFLPVALDSNRNLFIADRNNHRIRRVDAVTGVITTVAGGGSEYSATVVATAADFKNLSAIAVDDAGNILAADTGTQLVRRLDVTTNLIATIAGNRQSVAAGSNGDGGSALDAVLNNPQGLAVDASGNVHIAESGGTVRRIDVISGLIDTVDGNPGDGANADAASLLASRGVTFDATGRLAIADLLNNRIHRVPVGAVATVSAATLAFGGQIVGTTSAPRDITFWNTGVAPLSIAAVTIEGDFSQTNNCGPSLPPGASCTLSITFSPGAPGDRAGLVRIQHNADGSPQIVKLDGTGDFTATLTWETPPDVSYGTPLDETQLNAFANLAGTFAYTPPAGAVLPAASHSATVTFTPADTNYPAMTASTTLTVVKAVAPITWAAPDTIAYGTRLGGTQLNASSTVPGTFTYSPPAGQRLDVGLVTLSATFSPGDTANYLPSTISVVIEVRKVAPVIQWDPGEITFGTALGAAQQNASVVVVGPNQSVGTFFYAPGAGTVLQGGVHTVTVTFSPTDPGYAGATLSRTITVRPATPVVTWFVPGNIVAGTPLTAAQLAATANPAGTFVYTPAAGTVLPIGTHTLSVTFTPSSPSYTPVTRSVPISVKKPSTLVVNTTTVVAGAAVMATLADGWGDPRDRIGLFAQGGSVQLDWRYLNGSQQESLGGVSAASVEIAMPTMPGIYEFRFIGWFQTLLATSAPITVVPRPTTTPSSISVAQTTVAAGATVTATVVNGPGMTRDWVGVHPLGSSSYVDWTYLNGSKSAPAIPLVDAAVPVRMPTMPGSYVLRLYSGSNTLVATSATITVAASPVTLTVNQTTVTAGGSVTVTVAGGPANRNDWLGVHAAGSLNYLTWVYLNGSQIAPVIGISDASVSVTMPATPGSYTIKFYAGSTLLATSNTITVTAASSIAATLSAAPLTVRSQGVVSATIAGGPGNATDWVALYPAGSSNYVEWKYLNGLTTAPHTGTTSATVPFTMPASPGTYVLKFWGGGTLLATSATITVAAPTLTVDRTSAAPGETVSATVANGSGNRTDWIGISVAGASGYLDWVYLNGSQTAPAAGTADAVVPVVMPLLPGSYTLKLFTGATELAVSEPVIVR